jgi:hypothetical protein
MKIEKKGNKFNLAKTALKLLDACSGLNLSQKELEYIAFLMCLPYDEYKYRRFHISTKRLFVKEFKDDTVGSINGRIFTLVQKGIFNRGEDRVIYFHPVLEKLCEAFAKETPFNFKVTLSEEQESNASKNIK